MIIKVLLEKFTLLFLREDKASICQVADTCNNRHVVDIAVWIGESLSARSPTSSFLAWTISWRQTHELYSLRRARKCTLRE